MDDINNLKALYLPLSTIVPSGSIAHNNRNTIVLQLFSKRDANTRTMLD